MPLLTRAASALLLAAAAGAAPAVAQSPLPTAIPPRNLVLSEAMYTGSESPMFVELDSGVAYRVTVIGEHGVIFIAPEGLSRPPLRFAPISGTQAPGHVFMAPLSGTYRVYAAPAEGFIESRRAPQRSDNYRVTTTAPATGMPAGDVLQVTIYREEADNRELRCARDAQRPECPRRRIGLILAAISIPIALLMLNR